jgi:hypothetical protein
MMENGNVLLFDNGMHINQLPRSRVLEVNPETDEIEWSYESEHYLEFFSPHISGAQRLWNGNTLICEGDRGRLFEVTPKGEVVWEFYNPHYTMDKKAVRIMGIRGSQHGWGQRIINWVFRANRYPMDYPAFKEVELPNTG